MQRQQADAIAQRLRQAQALEARAPSFLREDRAELATAGLVQRLETVVSQASPRNRTCAIRNPTPTPTRQGQERFTRAVLHVRIRWGHHDPPSRPPPLQGGPPNQTK